MSRSGLLAFLLATCVAVSAFAGADLSLGLAVPPKSPIGATVSLAMEVDNLGPDSGGTFTASYTPPPGYTFAGITSYQTQYGGISCTPPAVGSNGGITCSGGVRLGAGPSVSFDYKVSAAVAPGTAMVSTASLSDSNDPNPANNSASVTSIANAIPDLRPSVSFPATYTPGVDFHFTAGLKNNGPMAATNVSLSLAVSNWAKSMVQTAGPAMQCTNNEYCVLSSLAAGEQVLFDVVDSPAPSAIGYATATVEGALNDFQYYTPPAFGAAVRSEVSDIAVVSSAPAVAKLGDTLEYKVLVSNAGPSTATHVTLTWTTPPGTTFLTEHGADFCTVPLPGNSGTVTCTLSQVDDTFGATVFFDARVAGTGTIVNSATVSCASDTTPSNNTTTASTTVDDTPHADVSLGMTGPAYALGGRPATVQLTFHNAGPSTAQAVSASLTLSSDLTLDPSSDCGATCSIGDMAVGATMKKTLIVIPGAATFPSINATATSATPDLNTANNSASVTLHVYPPMADLHLGIANVAATVAPGGEITLTPQILNRGPAPATPTLSIDLPAGAKLLLGAGCITGGATATCTAVEYLPGGAAPFELTFQASAAPGVYEIAFHASSALNDPNPGDNQASYSFTVAGLPPPPADLALSIHPSDVATTPGAEVAFAIVVENRGPNPAKGVIVSVPQASLLSPVPASLGAGESATIQAVAIAPQSGSASVDVAVTSSAPDPDPSNNAASLHIVVADHPRHRAAGH